ncbi:hypothetical protein J6590_084663 [Homalodisca vitripennis]|nr:hypothetical protein J6590_084663 [Homalodisca vitripennis]
MNENQKRIETSVEVTLVETVGDTKKHGQSSVLLQELMLIQIHILMHKVSSWLTQLIAKGLISFYCCRYKKAKGKPDPSRNIWCKSPRWAIQFFAVTCMFYLCPGQPRQTCMGAGGGRWRGPTNYLFRGPPKLNTVGVLPTSEILPVPVNRSRPSQPSNGGSASARQR